VKGLGLSITLLLCCHCLVAQSARRVAFLPANSKYAELENRLADRLIEKFAGRPGLTVTDRQSIEKIIKEQNFQNSTVPRRIRPPASERSPARDRSYWCRWMPAAIPRSRKSPETLPRRWARSFSRLMPA